MAVRHSCGHDDYGRVVIGGGPVTDMEPCQICKRAPKMLSDAELGIRERKRRGPIRPYPWMR
jgi:hypothetical protein